MLVTCFGSGGEVTTNFGDVGYPAGISAISVVAGPVGRVFVGGQVEDFGATFSRNAALVRFNADGSLDGSFGTGGKVVSTPVGSNAGGQIALQPDGKVVVLGDNPSATGVNFVVARYNGDGSPDTTFGSGGIASASFTSTTGFQFFGYNPGTALTLQGDGSVVVAGGGMVNVGSAQVTVARFTSNGTLDTSFGNGGLANVTGPPPTASSPCATARSWWSTTRPRNPGASSPA
jgi:uncharacterized delta-60 repeat protein